MSKMSRNNKSTQSGKTVAGSQRYSCKHCKAKYTPQPKEHGYPDEVRRQAIRWYVNGMNYRQIARHLQVHNTTVINWVKVFATQLPNAPMPEEMRAIKLDELFTFIETKKNASTQSQLSREKRAVWLVGKCSGREIKRAFRH